jgi:hypothetical protein
MELVESVGAMDVTESMALVARVLVLQLKVKEFYPYRAVKPILQSPLIPFDSLMVKIFTLIKFS